MRQAGTMAWCAAAVLAGWTGAAAAEDKDANGTDVLVTATKSDLAKTSSASRLGLTVAETPASVETIDGEVVRARGDLTIQEAVSRATGVTFVGAPGNGNTALTARGFSGQGSVQLLVNGTRLYVASGTLTFPIDPWTVERIDVLRGPSSVQFGEGAIGGAINVVMKAASPDRLIRSAQLGFGSDATVRGGIDVGAPLGGGVSARIAASYTRSSGWLDRNDFNRNLAISGSVRYDASSDLVVTLASDYGDVRILPYFGMPLNAGQVDARFRRTNFNIDAPQDHFRDSWTRLTAQWTPSAELTVRNVAYYLSSKRDYANAEAYLYVPATGRVVRGDYLNILHDQDQYGNRGDVTWRRPLGGLANALLIGFDVNRITFRHTNNSPYGGTSTIDPLAFDPGSFLSPVPTTPGFATRTTQFALFAEDQLKLAPWLSLVGGLRHDRFDFARDDLRVAVNSFARAFHNTSWRVGAVATPTSTTSLYGAFTTGADPLGALITTSTAQRSFGLSPAKQLEFGVKQSLLNGHGAATLAVFDIDKRRLLTTDPLNRLVTQQVGRRSSTGVEAMVSLQLTDRFGIEANGTILRARFDQFDESVTVTCPSAPVPGTSTPIPACQPGQVSIPVVVARDGNTPPGVPTRTAAVNAAWRFVDALQARVTARFVGGRWIDNANTLRLPAYEVIDAGLRWQIDERFAMDGRVSNLFDKVYAVSGTATQWLLGTPRRFDVRLDVRL